MTVMHAGVEMLAALADTVSIPIANVVEWDTTPRLPDYGFGDSQAPEQNPIQRFLNYAQGVIVVLGVLGILYSAGKMVVGRLGRSEVAAEGVGGVVWTIMGVSLMLVAIPVATTIAGV
ncbi:hypothetical protein LG943_04935 [Streptomonospora sp. S1-112]|uniref:Uncharacterized protein n=1 Tax=Streptomonospora mangrovi TaxID=2883123 RepID=A0A9X3NKV3_9ACTN|nr:hypothetical protein [Streptomonospora mangrovi]MDA0563679.1 hypothetical protein [Streptomonospora mangrovi]